MATTSLKLSEDLRNTVALIAQEEGVTPHAFMVEAINRAGSTDPNKILAALKATDLKPNQLMMGYRGVKFDEKGNNILASALLIQIQGNDYVSVWPKESATAPLQMPYKGW
jgi:branched-chain amino acid transport system substrate-binding protein